MSSREYKVDRREIGFVLREVFEVGKLCHLPAYADFDEEVFNLRCWLLRATLGKCAKQYESTKDIDALCGGVTRD